MILATHSPAVKRSKDPLASSSSPCAANHEDAVAPSQNDFSQEQPCPAPCPADRTPALALPPLNYPSERQTFFLWKNVSLFILSGWDLYKISRNIQTNLHQYFLFKLKEDGDVFHGREMNGSTQLLSQGQEPMAVIKNEKNGIPV